MLDNYDYSYTELDALPDGWVKCFGLMMVKEMNDLLERVNYTKKFRIVQAKEKFGSVRIYHNGVPREISEEFEHVIDKYSHISENVCACCGRPDVFMTFSGWDYPFCKKCWGHVNDKREYEQVVSNEDTGRMADSYTIHHWGKDGDRDITYDISATTAAIRRKYESRSNRRVQRKGGGEV